MNVEELTARINALYHKSKDIGLTDEEKTEQAALRKQYIANVRGNLKGQLDHINIQEKDGSITKLADRYGDKQDSVTQHKNCRLSETNL